jgi:flotillin
MSHIDSLTVLSSDGASDIVRNATRAMVESTTAIKGLTGLDVPSLVGGALGRGFGEKLRTGEGNGDSGASPTNRISEIAGEGLTTLKAAQEAAKAKAAADAVAAKVEADAEAQKAKAAVAKVEAEAQEAKPAINKAVAAVESKAAAVVAKVAPSDGNVTQWAKWAADSLRRVPNIQIYDALRLMDLESRGPEPARGIWATAKEVLGKDYGKVTIGDLLRQFGA